jgi:hypothetical protein
MRGGAACSMSSDAQHAREAKTPTTNTFPRANTLLRTTMATSMIHGAQLDSTPGGTLLLAVILQVS